MEEIVIETWGDFACFTNPAAKVERLTYPFPTPSAARGILSAIYAKPVEFYWQVNRIEVLNPIRYISFKRNEVKSTLGMKDGAGIPIVTDEDRTQRQTVALQDVRYRIAASVV
ncbi:MAG: CRISPR-associated protein Cas5, partial [Clostridia bacterium]|nr:CRISPR-associated protein Cas5 [Clostridia bacterium]